MMRLVYGLVVIIGVGPTSMALAQVSPPGPIFRCTFGDNPDERVGACTAIIQSGSESQENRVMALHTRGGLYANKGDIDRAIQDYDEGLRLNPNYVNLYHSRGNAYRAKGDNDRAIRDYDEAIRLGSTMAVIPDLAAALAFVFNDRGKAYNIKGDNSRAIQDYDEAIKLYPSSAAAFYNRGIAKRASGDISGGDDDITRAKQIDPTVGQ